MKFLAGLALSGLLLLSGCGIGEIFGGYDVPESPDVAEAPWPRLVDVPTPPPAKTYAPGYPDPAEGETIVRDLTAEAAASSVRAGQLSEPVIPEQEAKRLKR